MTLNVIVTLKCGYRSLNVIETGAIRKLGCGFLFAFYSHYGAILYRFRDIATYWSKVGKFLYSTCIYRPRRGGVTLLEFREDVWYT